MSSINSLPLNRQPEIRVLPMPADTNASGDIFGGWLMSQVDIAGSITAHRRAGGRVVTVTVNEFVFLQPIYVGDLVSIYGEIIHIGRSSIRIHLEAYAERERGSSQTVRVAEAEITYVALNEQRRPRQIS